jgi:hypothetical protein
MTLILTKCFEEAHEVACALGLDHVTMCNSEYNVTYIERTPAVSKGGEFDLALVTTPYVPPCWQEALSYLSKLVVMTGGIL